jgi:penicillin-binding protein-related factor A (putative recombinase)
MTRAQQRRGNTGQNIAKSCLERMGIAMVEKIGTPVRLVPVNPAENIYKVYYGEKVSGDHHGILPGSGIGVLAETKTILDRNLVWSDLREHQPARLQEWADNGGLSLLVWVSGENYEDVFVMMFPIDGFGPGKGISKLKAVYEHGLTKYYLAHGIIKEKVLSAE